MYEKIITAIDLSDESELIIRAGLKFVNGDAEKLHLVHTVEPISAGYNLDLYAQNFRELEEHAVALATEKINTIAQKMAIPAENTHIILGQAAEEVRAFASASNTQAIVIGSHGRSGWKLMLGATANKLLHGATCDVLTIYVGAD